MNKKETIEDELVSLWRDLLGKVDLDRNCSFFDLGGDDFLYSALLASIANQFSVPKLEPLESNAIFLNQLKYIENNINRSPSEFKITKLNKVMNDKYIALIFIHPLGGTLFNYMNLVNQISVEFPIYGVQDRMYVGNFEPFESLPKQAEFYVEHIKKQLSENNIILLGHSSGGTLAFEIAYQLSKSRLYTIHHLIMFDSWIEVCNQSDIEASFKKIMLRQIHKLKPNSFSITNFSTEDWLNIIEKRMNNLFSYKPKKLQVNATLFIPLETVPEYQADKNLHQKWKKYISTLLTIESAGNHETMLDQRNLPKIANHINNLLTKVKKNDWS